MATIYKRGKTYYIEYLLNGRRVKQSLKVRSKHLAELEKARIESELEKGKIGLSPTRIAPIQALEDVSVQNISGRLG